MKKVNKQIEESIPQEFDVGAKVNFSDADIDGEPWKPKAERRRGSRQPGSTYHTEYIRQYDGLRKAAEKRRSGSLSRQQGRC